MHAENQSFNVVSNLWDITWRYDFLSLRDIQKIANVDSLFFL